MSSRLRITGAAVIVVLATLASGYAADRLVLKMALEHQAASAQLTMAAAMGGLFAAGLVALLAILIVARAGTRPRS